MAAIEIYRRGDFLLVVIVNQQIFGEGRAGRQGNQGGGGQECRAEQAAARDCAFGCTATLLAG
ncbi:hypothetical protein [Pseudohoeflea suaedae]|uniref:hypothetical protein n=1 Tax=Pseudohoeflea suaedae TaxID=877384 RepID=UPI001FCECFF3|nr:hypothetical protein [Pseudohoeflea suaedae]